jgi:hypothetical protein
LPGCRPSRGRDIVASIASATSIVRNPIVLWLLLRRSLDAAPWLWLNNASAPEH